MRIIIFGATGGTGIELIKQSLEQNLEVTAFVRNPTKLNISHPNLSVVKGDVRNLEDVVEATREQKIVISALGTKPWQTPICTTGIKNIITAMKKNAIQRIVVESSYGTGITRKSIHGYGLWLVIRSLMHDKEKMETLLFKSNLDWTIIRPVALIGRKKVGRYRTGIDFALKKIYPTISRADVAEFMLNIATNALYIRQLPIISY